METSCILFKNRSIQNRSHACVGSVYQRFVVLEYNGKCKISLHICKGTLQFVQCLVFLQDECFRCGDIVNAEDVCPAGNGQTVESGGFREGLFGGDAELTVDEAFA